MTPDQKALLLADAARIAALPPEVFNMDALGRFTPDHTCLTPACIGGWVREWSGGDDRDIAHVGEKRWGLKYSVVCGLMYPEDKLASGKTAFHATTAQGAQAMINVAEFGEPRWGTIQ